MALAHEYLLPDDSNPDSAAVVVEAAAEDLPQRTVGLGLDPTGDSQGGH